mgnify:CR=1 FL=1
MNQEALIDLVLRFSALAMELAEGETLAELGARGPVPVDDALDLAVQIATGLEESIFQFFGALRDLHPYPNKTHFLSPAGPHTLGRVSRARDPCDDGLWCNGADSCDEAGDTCNIGTPPT